MRSSKLNCFKSSSSSVFFFFFFVFFCSFIFVEATVKYRSKESSKTVPWYGVFVFVPVSRRSQLDTNMKRAMRLLSKNFTQHQHTSFNLFFFSTGIILHVFVQEVP